MKNIYETLVEQALVKTRDWKNEDFLVRGLWKTILAFKPNPNERAFNYTYMLAQVIGQGVCYCSSSALFDKDLVGQDAREVIKTNYCKSVAVLDAIYSTIPKSPKDTHVLKGNSIEKTHVRNNIIADEVDRLCTGCDHKGLHVVNVGVVGDLLKKLIERDYHVTATDLDENIIGRGMSGVVIQHGLNTLDYVRDSDVAIISGMTLATDTLEAIIDAAKSSGTKLLMFAETGANFAEEYINIIGLDVVVSEPFPFYIFQGVSYIDVFRRA